MFSTRASRNLPRFWSVVTQFLSGSIALASLTLVSFPLGSISLRLRGLYPRRAFSFTGPLDRS
jgi:hypothetical protein